MTEGYNRPTTKEEAIYQIENKYHAKVDLANENLSIFDQLAICEAVDEVADITPHTYSSSIRREEEPNEGVNVEDVYGNGGYKFDVNFELNESKFKVIEKLKKCNSKTSPYVVESLLKELFPNPKTKSGHWLHIAQAYTPRPINRVINEMVKAQTFGSITIWDAAAFFTNSIKFRSKRKIPKKRNKKYE